jgi:hypothetical protein
LKVHYGAHKKSVMRSHPATVHRPENTGDNGMDVIVVELKGKAAKAAMK